MKFPQFRVRTLLLLTAIMGVVFVACAKWPVTELVREPLVVRLDTGELATYTRPPTFNEWAVRVGVSGVALLAVFVLIGAWRNRLSHAT